MKCSNCKMVGHNKIKCPIEIKNVDTFTKEILQELYSLHKKNVNGILDIKRKTGLSLRLPCFPDYISENIIKFIIHNKLHDNTSTWQCVGDLFSKKEGIQECKCFTSDGPLSFSPSSDWNVIYFLDATNWLNDHLILYRIQLKKTSIEWKNIKVNKSEIFEDHVNKGVRPRITWDMLYPQIEPHCNKVYEGSFEDIFILDEIKE